MADKDGLKNHSQRLFSRLRAIDKLTVKNHHWQLRGDINTGTDLNNNKCYLKNVCKKSSGKERSSSRKAKLHNIIT